MSRRFHYPFLFFFLSLLDLQVCKKLNRNYVCEAHVAAKWACRNKHDFWMLGDGQTRLHKTTGMERKRGEEAIR